MDFITILRNRLAALVEQRSSLVAELEAITATAATEERSQLTADESARYDAVVAEVNALDADDADDSIPAIERRIGELEAIAARQIAATAAPIHINRGRDPFDLSDLRYGATRAELQSRALAALDSIDSIDGDEKEAAERTLRRYDNRNGALARRMLVTGRPEYRSAFEKVLAGDEYGLTDGERAALSQMRAASLTDASGGFAVPFTLDPTVINTNDGSVNPFRQISTVKTTVTDSWNGVSSAGVTASWDAEAAEVSDDAPTLAQPSIAVHKAQAFVPFSIEVGMDWSGADSEFRAMIAEAKDDLEATAFATGTGSGQPTGIVTALDGTASEIAPTTAETFAVADLYKLEEDLPAKYRARARWVANKAIFNDVRQFGTADSHALWERLGAGQPAQLLGYPTHESSAMDAGFDAAVTADNFLLILGDFSRFYIVDRIGLVVDLVPHLFGANRRPTGQRGIYAFWRTGSDSVTDAAFRMLNIATTL